MCVSAQNRPRLFLSVGPGKDYSVEFLLLDCSLSFFFSFKSITKDNFNMNLFLTVKE